MPVKYIRRGPAADLGQTNTANANLIYVDSDTDTLKFGAASSGTTEKESLDLSSTQTVTGVKTFSALPVVSADGGVQFAEVTITTGQVLALNATPITLVAAPGANKVLVFLQAQLIYDFNTAAYAGIAAGEDLVIRFTDGSGAIVSTTLETTGLLDQVSDQIRTFKPIVTDLTPVANSPLKLHLLSGEITTGDSPLRLKVWYSVYSTGL